jgi:hypothetical protein
MASGACRSMRAAMLVKALKFLVGLCLLPVCMVVAQTVWSLTRQLQTGAALLPPAGLAMTGGFLLWVIVFFVLPRPFRTYVLAHELTHALWGLLMGARVARIRVGESRGSVELSKTNFLITLAPYFFPLYTVLVVMAYGIGAVFADLTPYYLWWLGAVGFTWGFHVTFTVAALLQRQSDIQAQGHVFAYAVIALMNLLGMVLWMVMVTDVTLQDAGRLARARAEAAYRGCRPYIERLAVRAGVFVNRQ